jgi:hypothetical protein
MTGNELYEEYCNEYPLIMGYREVSYESWLQRQVLELRDNVVNKNCNLQSVKASVLSDINKMIEKVEGWIDKDTSRRDKYLIHGQADGMRKAIHIIHQHLP